MVELFKGCNFFVDLEGLQQNEIVLPLLDLIGKCGGQHVLELADSTHVVLWHQQQQLYAVAASAGKQVVSPVWVYACMEARTLLRCTHKLYKPFPGPGVPRAAEYLGCISSFAGTVMRNGVLSLMACLGMTVTKSLTPKRNTHLVARDVNEQSAKVQAARAPESGMHVLNLRWPLDCLMQWRLLPEEQYTDNAPGASFVVLYSASNVAVPHSDNDSQGGTSGAQPAQNACPAQPSRLGPGGATTAAAAEMVPDRQLPPVTVAEGHATGGLQGSLPAAGAARGPVVPSSTATLAGAARASPSTAGMRLPEHAVQGPLKAVSGMSGRAPPGGSPSPTSDAPLPPPPHSLQRPQQLSRLSRGAGSRHAESAAPPPAAPSLATAPFPTRDCTRPQSSSRRATSGQSLGGTEGSGFTISFSAQHAGGATQAMHGVGVFVNGMLDGSTEPAEPAFAGLKALARPGPATDQYPPLAASAPGGAAGGPREAGPDGALGAADAAAGAAAGADARAQAAEPQAGDDGSDTDATPACSPRAHTTVIIDEEHLPEGACGPEQEDDAQSPLRPAEQEQQKQQCGPGGSGQEPAAGAEAAQQEGCRAHSAAAGQQPPRAQQGPGVAVEAAGAVELQEGGEGVPGLAQGGEGGRPASNPPQAQRSPSPEPPSHGDDPSPQTVPNITALARLKTRANTRSRSGTPDGSGSWRRRRKGAPERAMFSQRLPEGSKKELRDLEKALKKQQREEAQQAKREAAAAVSAERQQGGGGRQGGGRGSGRGRLRGWQGAVPEEGEMQQEAPEGGATGAAPQEPLAVLAPAADDPPEADFMGQGGDGAGEGVGMQQQHEEQQGEEDGGGYARVGGTGASPAGMASFQPADIQAAAGPEEPLVEEGAEGFSASSGSESESSDEGGDAGSAGLCAFMSAREDLPPADGSNLGQRSPSGPAGSLPPAEEDLQPAASSQPSAEGASPKVAAPRQRDASREAAQPPATLEDGRQVSPQPAAVLQDTGHRVVSRVAAIVAAGDAVLPDAVDAAIAAADSPGTAAAVHQPAMSDGAPGNAWSPAPRPRGRPIAQKSVVVHIEAAAAAEPSGHGQKRSGRTKAQPQATAAPSGGAPSGTAAGKRPRRAASQPEPSEGAAADGEQSAAKRRKGSASGRSLPSQLAMGRGAAHVRAITAAASKAVFFALSGFKTQEQKQLSVALRKLKVECIVGNSSHKWDARVTHIVAPDMKRNNKCLAGLAAGNWILRKQYVDDCKKAGSLLPPAGFELHDEVSRMVEAGVAQHWRQRKENLRKGAFEGLKVVVCPKLDDPGPSRDDVCTIIKAGGGTVVPIRQWKAVGGVDLVVAHSGASPHDRTLQAMVDAGALCVSSAYVVDWLAKPSEELSQHVLLGSGEVNEGCRVLDAERSRGSALGEDATPPSPIL